MDSDDCAATPPAGELTSAGAGDGSTTGTEPTKRCHVVALGASAGGLEAFGRFFRSVEKGQGLAFVVVQHLSPEHESILPQLLAGFTSMPVAPVQDGTVPEADHVYVIPPNTTLLFRGGRLHLNALEPRASRQPISAFFASLAHELGAEAVAVVLSGSGSDGAAGLHAIRTRGGLTIVQSPADAQYDSMPRAAIATGEVEFVVSAADVPQLIVRELKRRASRPRESAGPDASDPLTAILEGVRRHTGKDFGPFKRSTVHRRVQRRLTALGMSSFNDYLARLHVDAAEADALASDLMIGVTRFFRDAAAFESLRETVLPQLFEFSGDQPVRVWVPGCASGEEAYSLSIQLLAHAARIRGSTVGAQRVQVFATDINEGALAAARLGRYPASIESDVPAEWLSRYFVAEDGAYVVGKEVRDCCIFSVHDVLRDPPFSRVDLISCRNLLIYFDADVQGRLLPVFHYALRPSGFLFLGSSETVGDLSNLFELVDKKHRLFRKSNLVEPRTRMPLPISLPERSTFRTPARERTDGAAARADALEALVAGFLQERRGAVALVDGRGNARYFGGNISRYLPTPPGVPTTNVIELAAGDLRLEISAAIQAAGAGGGPIRREIALGDGPDAAGIELSVRCVPVPGAPSDHFLVLFRDSEGPPAGAPPDGSGADERAHELEGELRVATDRWRRAVQDLESANEELRSANEELQTMNEELQSSNEELQLSQEELQSVNEELNTVNTELGSKVEEVNGLYSDLQNLFQSTRIATVVVDRELCITRFTPAATKLYPLTQNDVGRPLANLADPFAEASVLAEAKAVLEDLVPRERILKLAQGVGWHLLRALPYLSLARSIEGVVLTFVDVTELKQTEAALRQAQERERRRATELEAIMRSVPAAVLIARDAGATHVVGNDAAYRLLRMPPGQNLSLAAPAPERPAPFRVIRGGREIDPHEMPLERAASTGIEVRDFEPEIHFRDDGHVHLLGQALPLLDDAGKPAGAVAAFMDVTRLKDVEEALRKAEARFRGALEAMLDAFAMFRPVSGTDGKPVDFVVEYLNRPARAILGVSGESGKQRLRELVPGSSSLLAVLPEAVERNGVVERREVSDAGGRADDRTYDLRACALEGGEVAVAWHDVTEQTRATRALREADQRKDEFLAVLGHELRNPLAALNTAISLEQRRGADHDSSTLRHIDLMRRQVRALGRLVDDLLDVTRITRGTMRLERGSVDLVDVVRAEFELQKVAASDRLRLQLVTPPSPIWVSGDAERITQVTGNLVGNARKFTLRGGAVEVVVRVSERGEPELVVRDQGIGMSPETLAHLFEPFRQADHSIDRARGGLGLGLYLVKGIVELMGAEVTARSDGPGRGSEFRVRFAAAEPRVEVDAAPAPRRSARPLRILVIEDNPDVRQSIVELLGEHLGHEVAAADDGESGVARAKEWLPDLVLCDIGLPSLDGYGVALRLREEPALRGTMLVAMTGYGSAGDKARALQSGFDRHFTKPLDVDEVTRFIDGLPGRGPDPAV